MRQGFSLLKCGCLNNCLPCEYPSSENLLHCSGPSDQLYQLTNTWEPYYVVQVCLIDRSTNQLVGGGCTELNILVQGNCSSPSDWQTGCDVTCDENGSVDLVCKTNDPSLLLWLADNWHYVTTGDQLLSNCVTSFETDENDILQGAALVCADNAILPDENGNFTFICAVKLSVSRW